MIWTTRWRRWEAHHVRGANTENATKISECIWNILQRATVSSHDGWKATRREFIPSFGVHSSRLRVELSKSSINWKAHWKARRARTRKSHIRNEETRNKTWDHHHHRMMSWRRNEASRGLTGLWWETMRCKSCQRAKLAADGVINASYSRLTWVSYSLSNRHDVLSPKRLHFAH